MRKQQPKAGCQTLTFKTRIYLDSAAQAYCERAFGVRRFVWNWALNEYLVSKATTNRLPNSWYILDKKYREAVKAKGDSAFEWVSDQLVSPRVMQETLKDLQESFSQCSDIQKDINKCHFKNKSNPRVKPSARKWHKVQPHFKKRKQLDKQSFRCQANIFTILDDKHFHFSGGGRGNGVVGRTRESLAFLREDGVKLCTFTIKREAGKYWICISYEKPNRKVNIPTTGKVGIDLGIVVSACTYDGAKVQNVSFNTKHSLKLERLSKKQDKSLQRKTIGSSRYMRELLLKQKREAKAARIRHDEVEKFTTFIAENYAQVVVDDFSFKSALKIANPGNVYHSMVYQTKLRLEQKLEERGHSIRYINHAEGERTTKRCSCCGGFDVVVRKNRTFKCRACHHTDDRDANAAKCTYTFY